MILWMRPHINGNEPIDFIKASRRLHDAVNALEDAMQDARALNHGRNYQHLDAQDSHGKRILDRTTIEVLERMIAEFRKFAVELNNASQ